MASPRDRGDAHLAVVPADFFRSSVERVVTLGIPAEVPVDMHDVLFVHVVDDGAGSESLDVNPSAEREVARCCTQELSASFALADVAHVRCDAGIVIGLCLRARVPGDFEYEHGADHLRTELAHRVGDGVRIGLGRRRDRARGNGADAAECGVGGGTISVDDVGAEYHEDDRGDEAERSGFQHGVPRDGAGLLRQDSAFWLNVKQKQPFGCFDIYEFFVNRQIRRPTN